MNDQDMQAQFIQWLAAKTGATTEDELKQVIQKAQSDGSMEQLVSQFQSEIGGNSGGSAPSFEKGGKISYIECLKQMKKGGKMDCGCSKPKVKKGLLGMIAKAATLTPKLAGLSKVAPKTLSLGQKALKFGMENKDKIAGTIQGGLNLAKNAKGLNTSSKVITPSPKNNYYGANAGAIESPQMRPMQRQVPTFTGNNIPYGGEVNTNPLKRFEKGGILVAQRGEKLRGKALKNYKEGENENSTVRKLHRADKIEGRQDARAERQIGRRNQKLVDDFNYQGTETTPGVFTRERNRFDEGAETMLKNRRIMDKGDAGRGAAPAVALPTERPAMLASTILTRTNALGVQAPTINPASVLQSVAPVAGKVNPSNIKGGKSVPSNVIGSSPIAKQIRVPNEQYPGSTTIMPGNAIGEVEAIAKMPAGKQAFLPNGLPVINLPKRPADMGNTPAAKINPNNIKGGPAKTIASPIQVAPIATEAAVPVTPAGTTHKMSGSIQTWAGKYAKAKAAGDKIGMRHWQDLLETAGGEGRPKK